MNAKKIMGAVLVALLAAALFTGAAAAEGDQGTYFIYQQNDALKNLNGTWTMGEYSVVIDNAGALTPVTTEFKAGTYTKGKDTIYVTYPTASYKASAMYDTTPYMVLSGGNVYNTSFFNVSVSPLASGVEIAAYLVTVGDNVPVKVEANDLGNYAWINATDLNKKIQKTGTYTVLPIFSAEGFVNGVSEDILLKATPFTFKVVGAADAKISASVDTVYSGENVTFTVTGTPGQVYKVNLTGFDNITQNQLIYFNEKDDGNQTFTMPNTGKAEFVAKVNTSEKEAVIKLALGAKFVKDGEIKIKVSAPVVTATLGADSYFIGDEIKVTGTSTAEAKFTFTIDGTNIAEKSINFKDYKWGKSWKATLIIPEDLDVGTYTIRVYQDSESVATLLVALKQPFISITDAPDVVVQGTEAKFVINAEAASGVMAYFFGTNYFEVVNGEVDEDVKNKFTVTLTTAQTNATNMSTGNYFAVFQHPMYDGVFNIGPIDNVIYQNNNGTYTENNKPIINVDKRQHANAAEALCGALDSQLVDDMYVPYYFIVAAEDTVSKISEIPSEVTKGTQIEVTGTDTANAGKYATVEMVSTAFAALPKDEVNNAAFILMQAKIADDGTWKIVLDTSDLNVDDYSVSVFIDGVSKKKVEVKVIEGAPVTPTDAPVTPTDAPVTPTEAPKTPGFGALAALAGLGAVAVLLLRRE